MRSVSRIAIATLTSAATIGVSACGGGGDEVAASSSAAGPDTAASLVRSALHTASAVESVRFVLSTSGQLDRQQVVAAQGDLIVRPKPSAQGTATVRANGDTPAAFVLVDGTMYADIGGAGFIAHRAGTSFYDVGALFDAKDGIPDLLRTLRDLAIAGEELVDGTPATRVTGTAKSSDLAELAGIRAAHGASSRPAPVTVWIQTSAPHNVVRISGTPQPNTEVRVALSNWGVRPSIAAPTTRAVPAEPTSTPPGVSAKPAK
ncbi:LppX_LprAFG lipoprotein [Tsukamurella paurometabola]|uniref:Lipoprotein lprA n=4 Tax=Tsukamurella paurometabola TaxID=2061 RepID=A0A3P8MB91_TSUPA|nr:LppX_LprAFG lipoprotein [Tsukamurella paurometabola]UEA85062.1 LppX_LprAFG lipoprotein [Tsukamurella paurometabola]VDR37666.1 Putative lipoprotein lprA precursor [Tsukamurella paurometabola]